LRRLPAPPNPPDKRFAIQADDPKRLLRAAAVELQRISSLKIDLIGPKYGPWSIIY